MYSHKHNQSGFSLVETLVAITILLIVITGPLTLVSNSARSTNFANDQVMAYFLAQEGLELVQSKRDDLLLPKFSIPSPSGNAWSDFTSPTGDLGACFSGGCGLDQDTNLTGEVDVVNCPANNLNPCRLYLNSTPDQRSAYTHDDDSDRNPASKYTRVITISHIAGAPEVEVESTVTWRSDDQRAEQEVQAVTYLFDVYGR